MSSSARKSTSHNNMIKKDFSIKNRRAGMNGVARLTTIAQVIGAVSLPALLVADMLMANPAWAATAPVILPVAPVTQHGTPIAVNTVGNAMTITQTAPTNIVQWQSFNIGAGNTVNVAQPSATAVLLNKIDTGTTATTINGMLNANGRIYIYNPNGVIFGRGATVNADTLIASSLKFDETRVIGGLLMPGATPVLGADPAFTGTLGAVQVDGDALSWATLKANTGGSIILAGPTVVNNGRMYAPDGQVILAAGNKVYLAAPQGGGTGLRGLVVEVSNDRTIVTPAVGATPATSVTTTGTSLAENGVTGQIDVAHGNATMVGYAVNQKGLISATTSVSMNGSVYLFARDQAQRPDANGSWTATRTGTLTLGANSLTQVVPASVDVLATQADVASGRISEVTGLPVAAVGDVIVRADTATISAATTFNKSEVKLNGADIQLQGDGAAVNPLGAQIIAHGGNVTIQAQRLANNAGAVVNGAATLINPVTDIVRVDLAPGSNVDVSGTTGTTLAMESNVITVNLRGTELANNVVLRNSSLYGSNVQIDVRKGTAMADVSGWLGLIENNIGQLSTTGGTVSVSAEGAVIQRAGSTINVNGGYVDYLSGYVNTSQLQLGEKQVDIGSALTNTAYTAVVSVPNSLNNYQAGYRQGSSAGTVKFSSPIEVLQGNLSGQVTIGALQRDVAAAGHPLGGELQIGNPNGLMDPLTGKLLSSSADLFGYAGNVEIGGITTANTVAPAVGAAFDLTNAGQQLQATTLDINPASLSANGFSRLTAMTSGNIDLLAPLSLAAGGHLWLAAGQSVLANSVGVVNPGGTINISAPINIPGGSVTITAVAASTSGTAGQVNIANGVGFDLAGRWVNDLAMTSPLLDAYGYPVTPVILQGGSLSLTAPQLTVGNNVSVDVSAGAWLNQAGKLNNGTAGSIALTAAPFDKVSAPANAVLQLGTGLSLSGYGFGSGGTVKLTGQNVTIGSGISSASNLLLDPLFFQQGGFTNYNISANINLNVAANTIVRPQAKSLMFAQQYNNYASGLMSSVTSPYLYALSGTATTRATTNLTMSALSESGVNTGQLVVNSGAKLILDPGSNLNLYAGQQLTELGMLSAQAGNIMLGLTGNTSVFDPAHSVFFGSAASVLAQGSVQRMFTGSGGVTTGSMLDGGTINVGVMSNGVLTPGAGFVVAQAGSVFDVSGTSATGLSFMLNGQITPKQNVASSGGSINIQARDGLLFAGLLRGAVGGVGASGGSLSLTLDGGYLTPANPTGTDIFTILSATTSLASLIPSGVQAGKPVAVIDPTGSYLLSGAKAGVNAKYAGQGYISTGSFATGGFGRLSLKSKDVLAFGMGTAAIDLSAKNAIILDAPNFTAFNNSANNSTVATSGLSRALTVNSAYIQLGSSDQNYQTPGLASTGNAKLIANANTLDLIGNSSLQGFGGVSLNAQADIRLVGLSALDYTLPAPKNTTGKSQGSLSMVGVLSLQDAQTYPTTLSDYTFIVADGGTNPGVTGMKFNGTQDVPGSLVFTSNGNTPGSVMSAAGSITAIAAHIIQAGNLLAPLGSITLGNIDSTPLSATWLLDPTYGTYSFVSSPNNPYLFGSTTLSNLIYPNDPRFPGRNPLVFSQPIVTADLTYRSGSVTSVAGAGVVPFGNVVNGSVPAASDWQYSLSDGTVVSFVLNPVVGGSTIQRALPVKSIVSHAKNITTLAGSVQNLSGGGSLMAYEFTPGAGGSLDVLAAATTFAINPNYQASFAPLDTNYSTGGLKTGDSVYLSGMPGLAAGYYTLLPAHYALLSGGFSVSIASGTVNMQANSNTVLTNGSMLMSGRLAQSIFGTGSTNSSGFVVSSGDVIRSQSQYSLFDAGSYFTSKANLAVVAIPGLPVDGGYIAFDANGTTSAALSLNGMINLNAAVGGIQGTADFSAPQITVVSSAAQVTGNAVRLLAGNLNALGADSLVLGGLRSQVAGGTHLTVNAGTVTLSNDALNPLAGKDIILAANNSIQLNAGSVLQGSGSPAGSTQNLILDGSGALLNVSGGAGIGMMRTNPATATGTLTIASGATVAASGSAILDATGGVGLAGQLTMAANSGLTLGSNGISMGSTIPLTLPATSLQLSANALSGFNTLSSLNLNSYSSTVDLYGALSLGNAAMNLSFTGAGIQGIASTAMLTANTLSLAGSSATASAMLTPASGLLTPASGLLTATANNLQLGNNSFSIHGFTDSALTANNQTVATSSSGQLIVDKNLALTTGLITTANGAHGAITAGGNMVLNQIAPVPPAVTVGMGGQLSFSAANITSNAFIFAPSGKVVMSAGNSGTNGIDINGGQINTAGNGVVFGSTTAYSPGGSISLSGGHVNLGALSTLDMSAVGAAGGTMSVTAFKTDGTGYGSAQFAGVLKADATAGVDGILPVQGQFSLLTDNMANVTDNLQNVGNFGSLNAQLNAAGFAESRQFRFINGDVNLSGADNITARQIAITADNGSINIGGNAMLDARGDQGGSIALYASQLAASGSSGNVTVNGTAQLLAGSTSIVPGTAGAIGRGGSIVIGTSTLDGLAATGAGSSINLAGGTMDVGGIVSNGTVTLRAPRLASGSDVAVNSLNTVIANSSATVIVGTKVYKGTTIIGTDKNLNDLTGFIQATNLDPTTGGAMYVDATNFMTNQSAIVARLGGTNANLSINPGIEVRSTGNLTVSVNEFAANAADRGWNLNAWHFNGAPVDLTLRAAGNLIVTGSISDGFVKPASTALSMPDWTLGTGASSNITLTGGANLTSADPLAVNAGNGNVNFGFAKRVPTAFTTLQLNADGTTYYDAGGNTVDVAGVWKSTDGLLSSASLTAAQSNAPITSSDAPVSLVRTGTGSIHIASGGDVTMGMAPFFVQVSTDPSINGTPVPSINQTEPYGTTIYTAGQASALQAGFTAPKNQLNTSYGATIGMTGSAAFGTGGGAVTIDAIGNVIGPQNLTSTWVYNAADGTAPQAAVPKSTGVVATPYIPGTAGTLVSLPSTTSQLVNNWLFRQGRSFTYTDPVTNQVSVMFEQLGSLVYDQVAKKFNVVYTSTLNTAWWAQTGYFNQGVATFGGGDVRVTASTGNIANLSASVATNAYMVTPGVLTEQGGGNLLLRAGGDILGGSFYVQKGIANIRADGSVGAGNFIPTIPSATSAVAPLNPVIALGDASFNVTAGRSAAIESTYNPMMTEQSVNNVVAGNAQFAPVYGVGAGARWDVTDVTASSLLYRQTYGQFSSFSTYGANSAVNLMAISGDMLLSNNVNSLAVSGGSAIPNALVANNPVFPTLYALDPTHFNAVALSGNLTSLNGFTMMPSSTGQLNLLAAGSVNLNNGVNGSIRMLDSDPAALSNINAPRLFSATDMAVLNGTATGINAHVLGGLHTGDTQPARIIALSGDIVGDSGSPATVILPKAAEIQAGRDIVNLGFNVQQNSASDVTSIVAGRDFIDTQSLSGSTSQVQNTVTGAGRIDISAGRNVDFGNGNGLVTRGNLDNPYLAEGGAAINISAGSTQANYAGFVSFAKQYGSASALSPSVALSTQDVQALMIFVSKLNPALPANAPVADVVTAFNNLQVADQLNFINTNTTLVSGSKVALQATLDLRTYLAGKTALYPNTATNLQPVTNGGTTTTVATTVALTANWANTATANDLWAAFRGLSVAEQTNYLNLHPTVVANLATSASGLATVLAAGDKTQLNASYFSSLIELGAVSNQLGYFDQMVASLYPTAAGATVPGNINVFASQIKTEQGGAINLFAPTGSVYSGLTTGASGKKPSEQGIFTIRGGALSIFVKNDLLVNQGRIFTLGGGDITLVSQFNNIDAGKGAKTASSAPPPLITIDANGKVNVDVSGSISGSGIATLITHPGQPAANIYVLAPRGIFNAGDAGVRSSGNFSAVASAYENANNISVAGSTSGIPSAVAAPSVSSPSAPSSPAAKSEDVSKSAGNDKAASDKAALKVEVVGYGINSLPATSAGGDGAEGDQGMTPSVEVTGYGSDVNPGGKPAIKSDSKSVPNPEGKHGSDKEKATDAGEKPGIDAKSDDIKSPGKNSEPGKPALDCQDGEDCLEVSVIV